MLSFQERLGLCIIVAFPFILLIAGLLIAGKLL